MVLLSEIISKITYIKFIGKSDTQIKNIQPLNSTFSSPDTIFWCSEKNISVLKEFKEGTFIVPSLNTEDFFAPNCNYILVDNPRRTFQIILKTFFLPSEKPRTISETAKIHPSVTIGANVHIGEHTVIQEGCVIGNQTRIDSSNIIHKGTFIGENVLIGSNNTIGSDGFGYEKNDEGKLELIPHIGNVVIEDNVHIGDNNTIDRAVIGSTIIRNSTLIDNHVSIAHNTEIGENSCLMAQVSVSGSVKLGRNVQVAPSASILNTLEIPDDVFIGMGAVVIRAPEQGDVVVGNPAKKIRSSK